MSRIKSAPPVVQIKTAKPSSIRAVNRSILLELIRRRQPIARAELARITGIFRSSVSDIVDELIAGELVIEKRATPSKRGRVPMSLYLNDAKWPILGLNIRPRHFQLAFAGLSGRIQKTWIFETPTSPRQLVHSIAEAVNHARTEVLNGSNFRHIGVAIPGHVDATTGRILWIPTHTELTGFSITAEIEHHTGISALADNDCNVGALSELWLAKEERKDRATDFVFLNVSDFGTGCGAVVNGEIYLGHDAKFAAEFGHMTVVPDGHPCQCGRRGCWEQYVSNFATWRSFKPRVPFTVENFEKMLDMARAGDARTLMCLSETAKYLSLGISNIGFALNPAEVVIAGRLTSVFDLIEEDIQKSYGSPRLQYSVRPARLSADDSLLHGSVCLALRDIFAAPRFGET